MADTQIYGTLCTDIGNAAIANAVLTGTKVNFTQIAVGDANGTPYTPSSNMTELKHQVWSGPIGEVAQDPEEANRMVLHAVLPSSVGGWVMREIGVLDDQGRLIAIGNTPEIPKEAVTTGAIMEMDICIYITVVDARGVNVVIDPTVVIASKADVNKLSKLLQDHKADASAHVTTLLNSGINPSRNFALTGLTAASGKVSVMFKAVTSYTNGDTVTIDGTAYTLTATDGSTLTTGAWAAGAIVAAVADIDNKILYVSPSVLKNPAALTVSAGYGSSGSTVYDGSAAKTVTVPYVTFHTSSPTGTLGDGEIYCVYES